MAQGVAWAAREAGVRATIVVPDTAPQTKLDAIERLGGQVLKVPFPEWWQAIVESRIDGVEGTFVHPVEDPLVMAGNGTIGLEIVEDLPDVDTVVCGFGGGGLSTGIASAVKALRPGTRLVAVAARHGLRARRGLRRWRAGRRRLRAVVRRRCRGEERARADVAARARGRRRGTDRHTRRDGPGGPADRRAVPRDRRGRWSAPGRGSTGRKGWARARSCASSRAGTSTPRGSRPSWKGGRRREGRDRDLIIDKTSPGLDNRPLRGKAESSSRDRDIRDR